jgi:hypothetical protein
LESTLALDRTALKLVAALHGGFSPTAADWTTNEANRFTTAVNDGVSWVYFPGSYEWSWLKPVSAVTLASGATTSLLPDDFNWIHGRIITASASGEAQFPVPVVDDERVLARQALSSTATGRPQMASVQAIRGTDSTHSGRCRLFVYPIADQAYTFQIKYSLLPDATTDQNTRVYGGAQHAQTFKAAVKAAYSSMWDSREVKEETMAEFQRLLEMSIDQDRKRKPNIPGLNLDTSDFDDAIAVRTFSPGMVNGVAAGVG